MKVLKVFSLLSCLLALCFSLDALAQDKDDELCVTDTEQIVYSGSLEADARAALEAQYPKESQALKDFILTHVEHANSKDIDAYMADFHAPRYRYPELEREYAERVMRLSDLSIEVRAIEIVKIQPRAASLHVRQLASYKNENAEVIIDDAIISYRLQKRHQDGRWVILLSDRKRLVSK